jgi:hypothetical protein
LRGRNASDGQVPHHSARTTFTERRVVLLSTTWVGATDELHRAPLERPQRETPGEHIEHLSVLREDDATVELELGIFRLAPDRKE